MRVHPGARRDALGGFRADGALKLEVTAAPEGGRANRAVEAVLAEALGLPPSRVSVVRGQGSRHKWVEVEGLGDDQVRRRLEEVSAERGDGGGGRSARPH